MPIETLIKPSQYHDSVSLMLTARALADREEVEDAAVVMATPANKAILEEAGLLSEAAQQAGVNDLVIIVRGKDPKALKIALEAAESLLTKKKSTQSGAAYRPKTIHSALSADPELNLAVISVAGRYAAAEAWQALKNGLHVLLFSDNVSIEDEIALKTYAKEQGLLLMGPGAGTTLLNGIALGFANQIPSGPVGIVSAAGTGLQEVSTLLARFGSGITQGIGVGGRDLNRQVGGMMMLEALAALQKDPDTQVIVLISKPPSPDVAQKVLHAAQTNLKPTVVCFLGGELENLDQNLFAANTLQEAAYLAAVLSGLEMPDLQTWLAEQQSRLQALAQDLRTQLASGQRYLRGLYSGGTLCYETQSIWKKMLKDPVYSNAPFPGNSVLEDPTRSIANSAIDLGEEEFTIGRPHPMIDLDLRLRRMSQEAQDSQVAAILLDVVLGYGAHPDPDSLLAPAIRELKDRAHRQGRELIVISSVVGTEGDPQKRSKTIRALENAGAVVCESNAAAAMLAGYLFSD